MSQLNSAKKQQKKVRVGWGGVIFYWVNKLNNLIETEKSSSGTEQLLQLVCGPAFWLPALPDRELQGTSRGKELCSILIFTGKDLVSVFPLTLWFCSMVLLSFLREVSLTFWNQSKKVINKTVIPSDFTIVRHFQHMFRSCYEFFRGYQGRSTQYTAKPGLLHVIASQTPP